MMGLTPRQADCLAFIRARLAQDGVAPTLDEIAAGLGIAGKSSAHRLVEALVERGHLRKLSNLARGLALADERLPDTTEAGLIHLAGVTGRSRDQLVAQAVDEFLARQVRP